MKIKKVTKLLAISILIFSMTGCTTYLKVNKKQIKNPETQQILVNNILCKTDNTEEMYRSSLEKYKVDDKTLSKKEINESIKKVNFDDLQVCKKMSVTGKYEGLWTNIFVKPLAWLIINIGNILGKYGLSIIITTLLVRGIVWPLSKKQAMQSENLKKAQPDLKRLENKYKNKQDQQSQMQKSQEMMVIYKKYGINPMTGCLMSFIQIPLFFAFYEAINRIPAIFEETFISFHLGTSPLQGLMNGHYQYAIFIILIPLTTYFSFKLNSGAGLGAEQEKQMNLMKNIMIFMMTVMAFSISSGIAIYWVISQGMTIIQNLLVKRGKDNVRN